MKVQRIILNLPVEFLAGLEKAAFAARCTRDELIVDACRRLCLSVAERDKWVSLKTAADRSGKSTGHLRRLCAEVYSPKGLARTVKGQGRRSHWQIREDADPAFLPRR